MSEDLISAWLAAPCIIAELDMKLTLHGFAGHGCLVVHCGLNMKLKMCIWMCHGKLINHWKSRICGALNMEPIAIWVMDVW